MGPKWLPTDTPKPTMSTSAGGAFVSRTTEVADTVSQKVPEDADSLTITVDLESVLTFSSNDVTVGLSEGGSVEASTSIKAKGSPSRFRKRQIFAARPFSWHTRLK